MSFVFVRIPANDAEEVEEIMGDKSGGLENDKLLVHTKEYFGTPMVDITALTIPTPQNNFIACSLYASTTTPGSLPPNTRATALVTACGYTPASPLVGDVFCGRCVDNEQDDGVWERLDMVAADVDPGAAWCRQARGSANRPKTAASLQSLLQTQLGGSSADGAPPTVIADESGESSKNIYGQNNTPVKETWGQWTQATDEIEVQIPVDTGLSTKNCKVALKRNKVSVEIHGKECLSGSTFDPIDTDESTFTFETENNQRWLVLHLAKGNPNATWTFAVR